MDIVFHDKTETIGEGNPFTVGSFKTLLIEGYGTAETSELKFWGKSLSGTKRALRGRKWMMERLPLAQKENLKLGLLTLLVLKKLSWSLQL